MDSCSDIVTWNSTFARNVADSGGAIAFVNGQNSAIMIGNCTISGNQALSGGGFYSDSRVALILTNDTTLTDNKAGDGGGIFCSSCKQVTIQSGAMLKFNSAAATGGACYFEGCSYVQLISAQLNDNRWVLACLFTISCVSLKFVSTLLDCALWRLTRFAVFYTDGHNIVCLQCYVWWGYSCVW